MDRNEEPPKIIYLQWGNPDDDGYCKWCEDMASEENDVKYIRADLVVDYIGKTTTLDKLMG